MFVLLIYGYTYIEPVLFIAAPSTLPVLDSFPSIEWFIFYIVMASMHPAKLESQLQEANYCGHDSTYIMTRGKAMPSTLLVQASNPFPLPRA